MKTRSDAEIRAAYSELATRYDRTRFVPLVEEVLASAVVKMLGAGPQTRILDVAAGTGRTAVPLARAGATVVALDLTPEMLHELKRKADSFGVGEALTVELGNAKDLPFADNSFDCVVSFRFLHLFSEPDQRAILGEMHRVVRPGGKVLVEFNNDKARWVGGFVQDAMRVALRRGSLSRVSGMQISRLYEGFPILARQGFSWPFIGTVSRVSGSLTRWLLGLSMTKFWGRYARVVWILSEKRAA